MMSSISVKLNKVTLIYGILVSIIFCYILFSTIGDRHLYVFLIGIGLGISLYHASFGFTGGWRKFIEKRDSQFLRSQLIMLALAVIVFTIFINSKSFIYDVKMIGAVSPISVSVIVGSFMFGFAMQLGGGCGSGTLFTAGSGNLKMIVTLVFFIFGSLIGSYHFDFWTQLPSLGSISLLNSYTKIQTILLQLGLISILYLFISKLD